MSSAPAALPDFDAYPIRHRVTAARAAGRAVDLTWDDGLESRFHVYALKENAPECMHPVSREQAVQLMELPDDLTATAAGVDDRGVWVRWSTGDESCFHLGWLRAHAPGTPDPRALPPRVLWEAETLLDVPRFGPDVRTDAAARLAWLTALHVHGAAIVEGLPAEERVIEEVPALVGPLRETNFGRWFVVETKQDAISNAYTTMALPVHTDLCTREYEPGLQFLHCIAAAADGGENILADGFRIAAQLKAEAPDEFAALATIPIPFVNKAEGSDFRHHAPMFGLDARGEVAEVRWSPWLRGPLRCGFDDADAVYRGLRRAFRMGADPRYGVVVKLKPGDLLAFDNRRVLHGRAGYDAASGDRKLVGCYVEREDLDSALRMAGRRQRAVEVAGFSRPA